MSSVVIAGDTSGTVTLAAPAVSGTTTLTLPATTGTFITTTGGVTPSTSGNLLTSNGTSWTSAAPASSGPVIKYVTDTTDIAVTASAPTQTNVGATFSVSIPTTGFIRLGSFAGKIINNTSATYAGPTFGIRIGSTNYWLALGNLTGVDTYFPFAISATTTLNDYVIMYGASNGYTGGANFGWQHTIDIAALSVPTGTQTVQLIVGKNNFGSYTGNFTLKGTTNTTRVGLEFVSV